MQVTKILRLGKGSLVAAVLIASGYVGLVQPPGKASAACTPATDYGTVTLTVNISTAASYRIWSRIMPPDTTNNSYSLEIDNGSCIVVGNNAALPANTWTWVDYRDGNTASKIDVTLAAGAHTIKLIGTEPSVAVDRLIFTSDTSSAACNPPSGTGDSCVSSGSGGDTTAPTVSYTFPGATAGETLNSGTIVISSLLQAVVRPTVTDDTGVTSATYKVNGTTVSLTAGQYTLASKNGDYAFNVTANDAANNTLNSTITVKSRNTDITRDGHVSLGDFTRLLLQWGSTNPESDLDVNGSVGLGDFTKILLKWTN